MNLKDFLNKYDITIFFQPIISTASKKTIGFEALTRAKLAGCSISPLSIFKEAKEHNISFLFDKYVRSLAIKKFTSYYKKDNSLLLFLNFESSLIDNKIPFEEFDFYNICQNENIAPSNIVLEIREDKITKTNLLEKFCTYYKQLGFNIALDDFGIGSSTFDRLSIVKPDIVKIDISIIKNIDKNFINSEILKAITRMCYKIGAVVLAEGVETEDEILKCKKSDISIYQGYYFSYPLDRVETQAHQTQEKIDNIILKHSTQLQKYKYKKDKLINDSKLYCNYVINYLSKISIEKLNNETLKNFMDNEIILEALYFINYHNALQFGETIISADIKKFYSPAKHGDCHYLKEYYHFTKNSKEESYLSQKYISKATGNMCRTFTKKLFIENKELILCLDMKS